MTWSRPPPSRHGQDTRSVATSAACALWGTCPVVVARQAGLLVDGRYSRQLPRLKELGWVELIDGDDADARQLFVECVHVVLEVEGLEPPRGQFNESLVAELDESDDADPPTVEEVAHLIDEISVIADQEHVRVAGA